MQALFRRIERVAPIDVPVLILGESGTGKELVARAIQRLSRRHERPFETLNCAELTRELLRSELFGHERGAFTGAVSRTPGLVARLDGGTLLMDEVGDLPADAQAMLLRFLQEGEGARSARPGSVTRRCARRRGDPSRSRGRGRAGHLPRGLLLPALVRGARGAAAARPS